MAPLFCLRYYSAKTRPWRSLERRLVFRTISDKNSSIDMPYEMAVEIGGRTMYEYTSRYQTAITIFRVIELFGWAIVVVGIIIASAGFFSGGILGEFSQNTPVELKLFAALPGIGLSFSGILSVALMQVWRSQVDSADYLRELLEIAFKGASSTSETHLSKTISETPGEPDLSSKTISETPGEPDLSAAQPIPEGEVLDHFDPKVAIQTAHYMGATTYVLRDHAAVVEYKGLWRKFDSISDADMYTKSIQ